MHKNRQNMNKQRTMKVLSEDGVRGGEGSVCVCDCYSTLDTSRQGGLIKVTEIRVLHTLSG